MAWTVLDVGDIYLLLSQLLLRGLYARVWLWLQICAGVEVEFFHSDSESYFFMGLALCSHALSWWHRRRSFRAVAAKLLTIVCALIQLYSLFSNDMSPCCNGQLQTEKEQYEACTQWVCGSLLEMWLKTWKTSFDQKYRKEVWHSRTLQCWLVAFCFRSLLWHGFLYTVHYLSNQWTEQVSSQLMNAVEHLAGRDQKQLKTQGFSAS